ncbi:MAG: nitroreductase family protein [Acidimicrobiales bacterium]
METYLALASLRAVRNYAERPVPAEVVERVLDAGRVTGSSRNRQPWTFVVLEGKPLVEEVAATVWEPSNLLGAALVVAVLVEGRGPAAFDAGRAAQSMMVAAWGDGVGSCPNGVRELDRCREALGLSGEEGVATVLSFGYPARGGDPGRRTPAEWVARADRKLRDQVVRRA